jgi:hypothetical protein
MIPMAVGTFQPISPRQCISLGNQPNSVRRTTLKHTKTLNRHAAIVLTVSALSVASLTFISCTTTTPPPSAEATGALAYQERVPGGVIGNTIEVRAKVTAIDQQKRTGTLRMAPSKPFPCAVMWI